MKITYEELDTIIEKQSLLQIKSEYIPSPLDIQEYILKDPDKYMLYIIWLCDHHPQAETEEEKIALRRLHKIRNRNLVIIEEECS